ncbi:hypothetical protein LSH36_874g01030 [Paralvinella palmiformis]|uniref:C-type lectin domain-containing protein n=1 Tax=Paralvinella palmiformis TaxID=53620 RepID=A0AAD9IZE5_9ANNE|nr:hypothetical protein LSH36_874g01030 [Paralvinella palmiformis]
MEAYTFTYVFVYYYAIVLMLAIQPTTQSDDTKRFCQNMRDPINVNLLQTDKIIHPTNVNIKYYLYRINESTLTWCDSYNVCKQRGQKLAILNTKELQQEMTKLNLSDVVKIWIAGRRKDYGSDWTWVNDALTDVSEDFTIYDNDTITKDQEVHPVLYSSWSSPSGGDCMTLVANGYWMATDCRKRLQYVICEGYISPTTESTALDTTGK